VRHADPVLRVRRERAVRVGDEEALHRRDRERIVAELELVERGLVGALSPPARRPVAAAGAPAGLGGGVRRALRLSSLRMRVSMSR
jgi:hypothetical protein